MIETELFYPLLAFIPALLNVGILLYVFFFVPRGKTTDLFSLFVFALVLWQAEDTIVRICNTEETARFWDSILCMGWAGFAPVLLHFACRYTGARFINSRFALVSIYLPSLVFYLLYHANGPAMFTRYEGWGWVVTPRPGTADAAQRLLISVYVIAALVILFRYAIKLKVNDGRKIAAILMTTGILIPSVQGLTTQVVFPIFMQKEIPVTSTFLTIFSAASIVSISRFKLFNISESVELEMVLEKLKNIVMVISPEQKLIYTNPNAMRIFSDGETATGNVDLRAIFPDSEIYNEFLSGVFHPTLAGNPCTNFSTVFFTSKGTRIDVLLSSELIRNNNQVQGLLVVAHDVTDRLKTLRDLEVSNAELERFAYVASHNLQEPLRMVTSFLQLLEKKYSDGLDEKANSYIQIAVSNSILMKKLIMDLLEFSRVGSAEKREDDVDMNRAVEAATSLLRQQIIEENAIISFGALPTLSHSNYAQMVQLIQNLVSNALKYRGTEQPLVRITAERTNSGWLFRVVDNGIGIEPEYSQKIFEMFQRLHTKSAYSGTGIGLAICKKIVEQHGGKIWVDPTPGGGSTFCFTIPVFNSTPSEALRGEILEDAR